MGGVSLDERTERMQLVLNDTGLISRALRGAVRKINPQVVLDFPDRHGIIFIGSPGPVIKYSTFGGNPLITLYDNGERKKTGELIDTFLRNCYNLTEWISDN